VLEHWSSIPAIAGQQFMHAKGKRQKAKGKRQKAKGKRQKREYLVA
jgi:uncharacterized protein YjbJ (UPF0337 family)